MSTSTTTPRLGRPPKYPWDEWLTPSTDEESALLLVQGVDYDCETPSFLQTFKRQARNRGLYPHYLTPEGMNLWTADCIAIWVTED